MQETRGFALKIKLVPNTYLSTRKNITEIHLHSLWYPSIKHMHLLYYLNKEDVCELY